MGFVIFSIAVFLAFLFYVAVPVKPGEDNRRVDQPAYGHSWSFGAAKDIESMKLNRLWIFLSI